MIPRKRDKFKSLFRSKGTGPAKVASSAEGSSAEPQGTEVQAETTQNLQERLWNQAYDNLKETEQKITEAYETILSSQLKQDGSTSTGQTSNEIDASPKARRAQMHQLIEDGLERTQRQAAIKETLDGTMQLVTTLRKIVDSAIKAAPEAALPWTCVCLGLEVLVNPLKEPGINRKGLTRVISRMEWYWHLSDLLLDQNKASEESAGLRTELEKHIVALYQKLLLYQIKSVCLYHRNQFAVLLRDFFKIDDWDSQLKEIETAETGIQRDSEQYNTDQIKSYLQKLATNAESLNPNLQSIDASIQDQSRQQENRHQDEKDQECLRDLLEVNPSDHKKALEEQKGGLLRDSYRWILDTDGFQKFRNDPQSRLLWIRGDPGKGKTMLMCGIIDELEKDQKNMLTYFFCQASADNTSNATAVLRGLIYQLATQYPKLISYIRKKYDYSGEKLLKSHAWQALSEILTLMLNDPQLEGAIVLVDALDECSKDRSQLLDFVTRSSTPSKWIVSSRNWPEIEAKLGRSEKISLRLELNEGSVSQAVEFYVRHKVNALGEEKDYDDATKAGIEAHLTENAHGTFLWVALVCQELQDLTGNWDALNVVKEIPAGLEDLYKRMIQRIKNLGRQNPRFCQSVLSIVITAYRPLHIDELGLLSGLPSAIRASSRDVLGIIGMCGSFLTVKDKIVSVIHQSAKDFLVSVPDFFEHAVKHRHYLMFSRSLEAMQHTLRRDIYNLEKPGYLTADISTPDPDPLSAISYSCVYWIDHLDNLDYFQINEELQDYREIHRFLETKFLNWLEALSLLRAIPKGCLAIQSMMEMRSRPKTSRMRNLIRDMWRFIFAHKHIIEIAPLQLYVFALLFSPSCSLVREIYSHQMPDWVTLKTGVPKNWNARLQVLESSSGLILERPFFSPHSTLLAAWDLRGFVEVWDINSGTSILTLKGHEDSILSASFSDDCKWLATTSSDRTIRLWLLQDGRCVHVLHCHARSALFTPDDKHLMSLLADGTIALWDITTGSCLRTLVDISIPKITGAFALNAQLMVVGSGEIIRIFDPSTGASMRTLTGHTKDVDYVEVLLDGHFIVSDSDNEIKVWDAKKGLCILTLEMSNGRRMARSSSDRHEIVILSDDGFEIWDIEQGCLIGNIKVDSEPPIFFAVSPDTLSFASVSIFARTIAVWDRRAVDTVQPHPPQHDGALTSLEFSNHGRWLASASDQVVKIWDVETAACVHTFEEAGSSITYLKFSMDDKMLASTSSHGQTVRVWDTGSGSLVQKLEISQTDHEDLSFIFSPDNRFLVVASALKYAHIWNIDQGSCLHLIRFSRSSLTDEDITRKKKFLTSSFAELTLSALHLKASHSTSRDEVPGKEEVNSIVFSKDGDLLDRGAYEDIIQTRAVDLKSVQPEEIPRSFDNMWLLETADTYIFTCSNNINLRADPAGLDRAGYEYSYDENREGWIGKDGERLLWLPQEYRSGVIQAGRTFAGYGRSRFLIAQFK